MKRIPIGISDFEDLRTKDYYFVDKSMLCADVVRSGAKVLLLPRPRRFGKTLGMSMLNCFFSDRSNKGAALFEGLAVTEHAEVMAHCGAYPTIFLTFKDQKHSSYSRMMQSMSMLISGLYLAHQDILKAAEPEGLEQKIVQAIIEGEANEVNLEGSLRLLTMLLHKATGKKVVVLIDEYDMPIHSAFNNGYYDEMVVFVRNLLSGVFKDNPHLEKGVLTGIMRIAKESIFSGLNNLKVHTLLDVPFSSHFGFTEPEVFDILTFTGQDHRSEEVKTWYNGYQIGSHTMYNPWSIMNVADAPESPLESHWVNTSDNRLIRDLVVNDRAMADDAFPTLLRGETIEMEIETNIVLEDIPDQALWSMMLFSGYLTALSIDRQTGYPVCTLAIPNREVRFFFEKTVRHWLVKQTGKSKLKPMLAALLEGNFDFFAHHFAQAVRHTLSYHDTGGDEPERVYHVFLLGMLMDLKQTYHIRSNRESGYGRYDIMIIPKEPGHPGFVFEFKQCNGDPQIMAKEALDQIRQRDYVAELQAAGATPCHAIGVACSGKQVALEIGAF